MARQASDRINTLPLPVATPFGVVHVGQWAIIMLKINILTVSSINNYMDSTKAITTVRKENASTKYSALVVCK